MTRGVMRRPERTSPGGRRMSRVQGTPRPCNIRQQASMGYRLGCLVSAAFAVLAGGAHPEERSMYQDYRVIDADGHVLEPVDLWERYIDPEFRHQAPRGVGVLGIEVLGHALPDVPGGVPLEAPDYTTGPAARYGFAARRNFDAESQLEALDIEGIDVAVLYPSRGLYAASVDGLPPRLAGAICRAYNRWLAGFCARAPERLFGAGFVSLHDPGIAVAEAVYAVEPLRMRAVFVRPNPGNGRTIDHPAFDPPYSPAQRPRGPPPTPDGAGGAPQPQVIRLDGGGRGRQEVGGRRFGGRADGARQRLSPGRRQFPVGDPRVRGGGDALGTDEGEDPLGQSRPPLRSRAGDGCDR